jgi:DNA modification methylase
MEINKIYCESNLETMAKMPDNFIDLTVTSPPYDGLRTYNGYSFPFEDIAKELYRVTKQGGVVVWVVGDATKNGSETGTSFKQALYFKEIGFNLHDTMIYQKISYMPNKKAKRYDSLFEYMFIFSKCQPKTFNEIIENRTNIEKSVCKKDIMIRQKDGTFKKSERINKGLVKKMGNVWTYLNNSNSTKDKIAFEHPAIFPEQLANDHIISWSNENDLVYDPFMGSGTTAKMAMLNNRNYIGSEISKEYCEIAKQRLKMCGGLFSNSFKTELSNEAGT